MRRSVLLVGLVLCACSRNPEPERALPICMVQCPAPRQEEVVDELSVAATMPATAAPGTGGRMVVTGADLNRIMSRRVTLWVHADSTGMAREIRVAQTSGSLATDRDLIRGMVDRRLPVERAGWYRVRVEPPAPR